MLDGLREQIEASMRDDLDMDHSGRVAIVTGAGSGIGRSAAEVITTSGGAVIAVDRSLDQLEWTGENDQIVSVAGDVSVEETNQAAVAAAIEHFGRLDASVLNAGVAGSGHLIEQSMDDFDRAIAVNVRGVVLGVRAAAAAMAQTSDAGAFCVTASTSGLRGDPGMWTYNASKGAVVNYVRSAALDLGPMGIRINAVAPGPTETGMTERLQALPEAYEHLRQRMAVQRWAHPDEVAQVISFLVSPAASIVTGAIVPADGGMSANTGQFLPGRR